MPKHVDDTCSLVHDLRNQLLKLFGSLSLMEVYLAQRRTEDVERLLQNALKNARGLGDLFDNLLDSSHAEASGEKAVDVFEAVRFGIEIAIPEKNIDMEWDFAPGLMASGLSRLTLTRIIRNLAENSVRAMNGTGRIFISAERSGDLILITFSDTGPGIPKERREIIFDGGGREGSGFGIGLPSVKHAVQKAGGEIRLIPSESGATFLIELPAFDPLIQNAAA